jgi:MFS family permease
MHTPATDILTTDAPNIKPPGNLFGISLIASLAGFIFGFDTVVISGANQPIKELWHTSPLLHGSIMSMALWGTVVGALFGGLPTDLWGRKKVLLWIGIFFSVSAIGSALAEGPLSFSLYRFLGGIGIGISSVAAPTYISEISTPSTRGRLVAMYQFNIVFGILVAFLSNFFLAGVGGENDWRWMLGVMAIPSIIYTVMVLFIPESPRWLAMRNNEIRVGEHAGFFSSKYKTILWLGFLIAFFNQWSGINFVLYYAPEILQRAGLASVDSLKNSIFIGGTNLIFTFVGLYLIDRLGRKTLLIIGSIGYIISLALVAYAFKAGASPTFLLTFLLLFIASHAIGQGAVIWVFIAEIFPTKIRARGQAFGASTHWVFAAIITLITPLFLDQKDGIFKDNPWPIFAFLAFMMVLQLVWVLSKVPETRGVSLEDLEKKLVRE